MIHLSRSERKALRQQEMLDVALSMVHTGGLQGLTVSRLSKAVGMTPGAIYRYYPSMGALISALNQRVLEGYRRAHTEAVEALGEAAPLEVLWAAVAVLIDHAVVRPEQFGMVTLTMADPRDLVEDPADAVHVPELVQLLTVLSQAFRAAEADQVLAEGDAFDRTVSLVFAVQGILQIRKLRRFDAERFGGARQVVDTVRAMLMGQGASERQVDAARERVWSVRPAQGFVVAPSGAGGA